MGLNPFLSLESASAVVECASSMEQKIQKYPRIIFPLCSVKEFQAAFQYH
jgi:hypothetical protein